MEIPATAHLADCATLEQEYWTHVSSQAELPIAPGAEPSQLRDELDALADVFVHSDDVALKETLASLIEHEPVLVNQLRLLTAVSDKRLYLDLSYIFSRQLNPSDPRRTLCGCNPHELTRHSTSFFVNILRRTKSEEVRHASSRALSEYFVDRGLGAILGLYSSLDPDEREVLLANLVLPGEYQQNEAKRRGHGAEARMALLLELAGVKFAPFDKVYNPMGSHDPNVDLNTMQIVQRSTGTFSCDVVVMDQRDNLRVCLQGLVQSSDPGQFGVEKAGTTVAARALFDAYNASHPDRPPVELWGIVDGVGYSENKAGTVNRLLDNFHETLQIKSSYKVLLGLARLGLCEVNAIALNEDFYSSRAKRQMIDRYVPPGVAVLAPGDTPDATWRAVPAGVAVVYL